MAMTALETLAVLLEIPKWANFPTWIQQIKSKFQNQYFQLTYINIK